jgi:predicted negative regulator of RcsB-dependent stress response
MERQVAAVARLARGQADEAIRLAKEAADIELTMSAPSGPPEPIKPALELYGDVLLAAGRSQEAAAAYDHQLLRTPNRTPSVNGLARARAKTPTTASR